MDKQQLMKLVGEMDSADGFYVTSFETMTYKVKDTLVLYLGFKLNGEEVDLPGTVEGSSQICVRRWLNPTEKERGECCRDELLLQSVCRYLNTGGKLENFQQMLAMANMSIRDVDFDFGGRYLSETGIADDDYYHVFTREDSNVAIHWWENNYIGVIELEGETIDGQTKEASETPGHSSTRARLPVQREADTSGPAKATR